MNDLFQFMTVLVMAHFRRKLENVNSEKPAKNVYDLFAVHIQRTKCKGKS